MMIAGTALLAALVAVYAVSLVFVAYMVWCHRAREAAQLVRERVTEPDERGIAASRLGRDQCGRGGAASP